MLGPLVVGTTLALLGTGLALVLLGETTSRQTLLTALGQRIDTVTLHQATFVVWAVVTGLHVLARLMPAWQLTRRPGTPVPGPRRRAVALLCVLVLSLGSADWVLAQSHGWRDQRPRHVHGADSAAPGRRLMTGPQDELAVRAACDDVADTYANHFRSTEAGHCWWPSKRTRASQASASAMDCTSWITCPSGSWTQAMRRRPSQGSGAFTGVPPTC